MSAKTAGARLCAALVLLSSHAHAHGGGGNSGGDAVSHGAFSVNLETEYVRSNRFSDSDLINLAGRHVHAHSTDYTAVTTLGIGYGVTDDLSVTFTLPHVYRENIRAGHHSHAGGVTTNSVDHHGDSGGIGDAAVQGRYRFLHSGLSGFDLSVLFGLKMPTGATTAMSQDETLETEFQAGSGSWDPMGGLALEIPSGGLTYAAEARYTVASEGAQATSLGDRATASVGVTWHAGLDYGLKFEGAWMARQRARGVVDKNSGGSTLSLVPDVRYTAASGWSAHAGIGLPLVEDLRSGHSGDSVRVITGIGKTF